MILAPLILAAMVGSVTTSGDTNFNTNINTGTVPQGPTSLCYDSGSNRFVPGPRMKHSWALCSEKPMPKSKLFETVPTNTISFAKVGTTIATLSDDGKEATICGVKVSSDEFWRQYDRLHAASNSNEGDSFCHWWKRR